MHMVPLEAFGAGSAEMFNRPCVDCGLVTGRFCDYCMAADRLPEYDAWHFCRGKLWCVPPPHRTRSGAGADTLDAGEGLRDRPPNFALKSFS